ncbi:MAG: hypothetical protein D6772_02780 [Bacteroidetes bacterium]|nr:MAG: hypothetical protein D6772_02780 [Bacteroidota bacterium]
MRIASYVLTMMLGLSLVACSDEDLFAPTQVVIEQPLASFPAQWLADYQDGQRYIFANSEGEEISRQVRRSPSSWESCDGFLDADTVFFM